jgi:hypothetical protein
VFKKVASLIFASLLLASTTYARPLTSFPDFSSFTKVDERIGEVNGKEIRFELKKNKAGDAISLGYYDGTLFEIDLAPLVQEVPSFVDEGFCPIDRKFPVSPVVTGNFIPLTSCPEMRSL